MTRLLKGLSIWQIGGLVAGPVLVAFGIAALVLGVTGVGTVRDNLRLEQIEGSPNMTPAAVREEAAEAGLTGVALPTCDVAGRLIDSGDEARCFAQYMRIHALEGSGGLTYAQLDRWVDGSGNPTSDPEAAAKDPVTGTPIANPARDTWVTATALTTALNTAFFAERVAVFTVIVGIALLLSGVGFVVLALGALKRHAVEAAARPAARAGSSPGSSGGGPLTGALGAQGPPE